jgi:DNA-binding winged helix-turn-helix (wHTH) protein
MDAHTEVCQLLNQIRAVTTNPAVIRASDQIEVLCMGYMEPSPDEGLPTSLRDIRGKGGALLKLLLSREGGVVTRGSAMNALYFDAHEEPDVKIVDVFVCQLRKKLKGTPYSIESISGVGYKLVKNQQFIPPIDRTSCRYGHAYDTKNTYIDKDGKRKCKKCKAAARARYTQKIAALRQAA